MQQPYEEEDIYQQLLQYLKKLLKRQNLCHNTYLYKQMHGALSVPLYIIAEEKAVSSISRNYDLIIDALQHTGLVRVVNGKEVRIVEHPTVKINMKNHAAIRQIQKRLQQKDIKYQISKRYDQDQYIKLTMFGENLLWLEALIKKIDPEIDFQKANLLQDIKFGVDRIRKLKFEHARQKTALGKVKYSLQNPPEVFVRKALESSDEDEEVLELKQSNGIKKNGNNSNKPRRYNNKGNRKPRIHEDDFPVLAQNK